MKKTALVPLVILLLVVLVACNDSAVEEPTQDEAISAVTEVVNSDGLVEIVYQPRPHRAQPASPDAITEDSAQFFAATDNPQLVEIFTYWCTTCERIRPVVHQLEAEYWGEIDFLYLDREASENSELNQLLGVRFQPEFYLIDPDGTVVVSWFGARSEEDIRAILDEYLASET